MPVIKQTGDHVVGGTLNQTAALIISARKLSRDSMLAHIVATVADAQRSRAPIQGLADKVAAWFVPIVIVIVIAIAVTAFTIWALAGPEPRMAHALCWTLPLTCQPPAGRQPLTSI